MKVKLFLHGHLRSKINKEYVEVEANTAYEAINALSSKYKKELKAPLDVGRWKCKLKGFEKEDITKPLKTDHIHIYPVFKTSKSMFKIVIGAILVVAGALLTYYGIPGGPTLATMGAAMIIGEVAMWFMAPKISTSQEMKTNSKYFGGNKNTTAVGTRIPFGYGLYKVNGHFISYNISSTYIKTVSEA